LDVSAVVCSWATRVAGRVGVTGGQFALHVRIPVRDVLTAYTAATH
jgi:hypothetical protein